MAVAEDELTRVLHMRATVALRVLLAVIVCLFIGAYWLDPEVVGRMHLIQAANAGVVVAASLWLRRRQDRRFVLGVSLVVVAATASAIAAGAITSQDMVPSLISLVALALGTATLLPWGAGMQAITVAISLVAGLVLMRALVHDDEAWVRTGGTVLPVLLSTIYMAYAYTRAREFQSRGEGLSRTIIDRAATGIVHVSARGKIVEANPALARMVGVSRTALRGRDFEDLLHPADRGRDQKELRELEKYTRTEFQSDRRLLRRDGGVIWARLSVSALPARGKIERVVMLEDVTVSKNAERQLRVARAEAERASKAKGEFLATMSHEIRTPMNAILGSSELLADTAMSETQAQYVDAIRTGGEQLLSLIDDILDFSKIEAGRVDIEHAVIDLPALVGKVQGLFVSQARRKRVDFKVTIDESIPPRLRGDATRLRQILSNLVGNAIKFTEGGIVYVRVNVVERSEDNVVVLMEVSDTGVGMGEDTLQRLFRPFTQADGSTTRKYGGTGLGLSIVKQLVELMGGEIGADSMPAVGSTFWCRIPFEIESASNARPVNAVRRRESGARLAGLRVLVAEDHPMNQMVIGRILETLGCDAEIVGDGVQAVKAVQRERFAVVFMDIHMPEIDGIEATKMILNDAETQPKPYVVGVTASALKEDRDRCLDAGMRSFLTKPVKREELEQALVEALDAMGETGRFRTRLVGHSHTDMRALGEGAVALASRPRESSAPDSRPRDSSTLSSRPAATSPAQTDEANAEP